MIDLARLGACVSSVGVIGDDNAGTFLRMLLGEEGVDTEMLLSRTGAATSATMLPISSSGVRPAWHMPGANHEFVEADVNKGMVASMDAVHYGGVTALPGLDGDPAGRILGEAKRSGCLVTADCLGIKRDDAAEVLAPMLPHLDVFMPNRDEALTLTQRDNVMDAARVLRERGADAVIVKMDADGCIGVTQDGSFALPSIEVDVVDSTGCGDAFCAGVIAGILMDREIPEAAMLGVTCGALNAQGLGSDAGIRDLDSCLELMRSAFGTDGAEWSHNG